MVRGCYIPDSKAFVGDIEFDEVMVMKNTLGPFKSIQSFAGDFCADIIIVTVREQALSCLNSQVSYQRVY